MELGGLLGLVWDKLGRLWAFRCFFLLSYSFLGFCFHLYLLVGGFGEGRFFWDLIVSSRVFFGLAEDFSFVSWVS